VNTQLFPLKRMAVCWMTGWDSGGAGSWADSATGLWGCDFSFDNWGWNNFLWLLLGAGIAAHQECRAAGV